MKINTRQESLRIALLTYSTKPRGGVVHTLELAEQMHKMGHQVHIFALGKDDQGFFRSTSFPFTLIPCKMGEENESLDTRIERFIDTYFQFLIRHTHNPFDIYHAQDCVSANALWKAYEKGLCYICYDEGRETAGNVVVGEDKTLYCEDCKEYY